jgi:hypothetical protein
MLEVCLKDSSKMRPRNFNHIGFFPWIAASLELASVSSKQTEP